MDALPRQYCSMSLPGGTTIVSGNESYDTKRRRELRELAMSAKNAGEEWGRRWYLSLAIGNAAALAAIASAILNITANHTDNGLLILRWALIPSAWFFAAGLVSGSVLPYCWKRKVEKIGDWVDVQIDELEENGVVHYPSDSDDDVFSDELIAIYDKHQQQWSKNLDICERAAVGGFLMGLVWMLVCFSKWAIG